VRSYSTFENEENKLLEYYEGKYGEATRIIAELENEIEELKNRESFNTSESPSKFIYVMKKVLKL